MVILLTILPFVLFSQDVLYEEAFTGGVLENPWYAGFNVSSGGKILSAVSMPDNPSGDEWVGCMSTWREVDSAGVAQSWSGDVEWTDYTYEANVYFPYNGTPGSMFVDYYALEFRVDTSGNTAAYQFMASFDTLSYLEPLMRFRKRPVESPANPITIQEWSADIIPGGVPKEAGWHKLAVKADGNQFWFYFDDQEMPGCPYSDTTTTTALLTKGPIGVYVFKMNFMGNVLDTTYICVDDIKVTSIATAIEDEIVGISPHSYLLRQNYPNPFNPITNIEFDLKESQTVSLIIYNLAGKKIKTLVDGTLSSGLKNVIWDATDEAGNKVTSGVYFYTLKTHEWSDTKRMTLIK